MGFQLKREDDETVLQYLKDFNQLNLDQRAALASQLTLNEALNLRPRLKPQRDNSDSASPKRVLFIPAASLLENASLLPSLYEAEDKIAEAYLGVEKGGPLYLAIDRWYGRFHLEDLLELLSTLHSAPKPAVVQLIGPTTKEILTIAGARSELSCHLGHIEEILRQLRAYGITNIAGGSDLLVHRLAVQDGFQVKVAQEIALKNTRQVDWSVFFRDLEYIRTQLKPSGQLAGWFPWLNFRPKNYFMNIRNPAANAVLLGVFWGSLGLENILIGAPWPLLNKSLSRLAYDLGSSDPGFTAFNPETAKILGIALRRKLVLKGLGF